MSLGATLGDLVDTLNAAGIETTLDPQNLNPPGVWVQLQSIQHNILAGQKTIRARLYLVAGDAPADVVLANLDELLADVESLVTPNTDVDTESVAVTLPNDSTPLPSLQLTVDLLERY